MKADEILGCMICSQCNLYFYLQMMQEIRENIKNGTLADYYEEIKENYSK